MILGYNEIHIIFNRYITRMHLIFTHHGCNRGFSFQMGMSKMFGAVFDSGLISGAECYLMICKRCSFECDMGKYSSISMNKVHVSL